MDDLLEIAKAWDLERNFYLVEPPYVWDHVDGWGVRSFETHMWQQTVEYVADESSGYDARLRALVAEYSDHLDFDRHARAREQLRAGAPIAMYRKSVRALGRLHGLSGLWDNSISGLLLSGSLIIPYFDCRLVVRETPQRRVFVELFPDTKRDDVQAKLHASSEWLGEVFPDQPDRRRARYLLTADLAAEAQLAQGERLDEVVARYDGDVAGSHEYIKDSLRKRLKALRIPETDALYSASIPHLSQREVLRKQLGGETAGEWYA